MKRRIRIFLSIGKNIPRKGLYDRENFSYKELQLKHKKIKCENNFIMNIKCVDISIVVEIIFQK